MKKLLTLTCLLILSSCAKEIPSDQLVKRQGLFYEINTTTPFNGRTVSYHQNGQLRSKANYKNGKYNDLREIYFENGELQAKVNYKNGKKDGLWEHHYRYEADPTYRPFSNKPVEWSICVDAFGKRELCNSEIKSKKGNYKNGKKDGLWELHFHVNFWDYHIKAYDDSLPRYPGPHYPAPAEKCEDDRFFCPFYTRQNYKDGKKDGLIEYYRLNGQLLAKGNHNDKGLDGPCEFYYDDGQLEYRINYKDGKKDGLWEEYYKNGQLKSRKNYIDNREDGLRESYFENGQLREKRYYSSPRL